MLEWDGVESGRYRKYGLQDFRDRAWTARQANSVAPLVTERSLIAAALAAPLCQWEKFAAECAALGAEEFAVRHTLGVADFLINYIRSGDRVWRDLYLGERFKQAHWPGDDPAQMIERRRGLIAADREAIMGVAAARLDQAGRARLEEFFSVALAAADRTPSNQCRVLFVGDCLFLDLATFLAAPLAAAGVLLRPTFLTSKNPSELRTAIRGLRDEQFDLVCYSPYTYEFDVGFAATHYGGLALRRRNLHRLAAEAHRRTRATLMLLRELFDCAIVIHTSANFRRHDCSWQSQIKNLVTRRARQVTARRASDLIGRLVERRGRDAATAIAILDERVALARHGDLPLGETFHDSGVVHPTVFSRDLAETYQSLILSRVQLTTKKILVADLDNTLWKGTIGEGPVEHDHRRQAVLKKLRERGVMLAICSKNVPRKIKWDGALLAETDFVAAQINWGPKAANLIRIAQELNLRLNDFVFLDDRADERALVQEALPEVVTMDPAAEGDWAMIEWWAALISPQGGADRAQLYRERRERQQSLDALPDRLEAEKLLHTLRLRLKIRDASKRDLPRVVELINRTNQFNTSGARTTVRELLAWLDDPQHRLLAAEAADKFGEMGLISALLIETGGPAIEIIAWVMSCRVFGFGIEVAMLNHLKRLAAEIRASSLHGYFTPTDSNDPCRDVYPANGFVWDGVKWVCAGDRVAADPQWLAIDAELISLSA
ncbi:MAG TPA: HAD-IIIC family phosphatase [Candidatus Binataceae bacterium]|nr:HAD-IIIC family phosphatase [Candidatus Binataceae bacterium]